MLDGSRAYTAALLVSMLILVVVGIFIVVRTSRTTTARTKRLIAEGKLEAPGPKVPKGKLPKVNLPGAVQESSDADGDEADQSGSTPPAS